MGHTNPLENTESQENMPTELQVLKARADAMGIKYSNSIGLETLRKKIEDKMNGTEEGDETQANVAGPNPLVTESEPVFTGKKLTLTQYLKQEAEKLVRIRITCMDPKKADLPGEFFTVANEHLGTVRKYVPFGEATANGYHVPKCIYDVLKEREFLHIQTRTVNGQIETKTRYIKEFAIEVLPQLTKAELAELATDQRATGRLEGDD